MGGSIAVRYRPKSLDGLIGNAGVAEEVRGHLKSDAPMFLLSGGTGLGKTTLGRIIARMLLCSKGDECGECRGCTIDSLDSHPSYTEVDIGEERGIDKIRELKALAQLKPPLGRHRVILLDECHALTPQAASALLKVLEEPPPSTRFILCTTDPQRVLKTIVGRCTNIHLTVPTFQELGKYLHKVARWEKVKLTKEHTPILRRIYNVSGGHIRDSLQMLGKLLARIKGGGELSIEDLIDDMLEDMSAETLAAEIVAGVMLGDTKGVTVKVYQIENTREFLQNSKFLLDVLIQRWGDVNKYNPPVAVAFSRVFDKKNKTELALMAKLAVLIAETEIKLNTGISETIVRYVFIEQASRQRAKLGIKE